MQKITKAEFLYSLPNPDKHNSPEKQIAFLGRSNVGKSSLINMLVNRKGLAKTSSTPGKTQLLNFFKVEMDGLPPFHLVDLPGYGFAKAPPSEMEKWRVMAERYLFGSRPPQGAVLIVDIRHKPFATDLMLRDRLLDSGLPFLVVASKADKIPVTKLPGVLKTLNAAYDNKVVAVSSQTGQNKQLVLATIGQMLEL